jgi:hypothetical protein
MKKNTGETSTRAQYSSPSIAAAQVEAASL